MRSIALHDLMVSVLAGDRPEARVVDRAFAASTAFWQRVLAIEACAVQFDRALRASGLADMAPPPLRQLLRDATARAVRHALALPGQMAELADASRELGIRIMVLKGAARHLDAGICGTRSMADIDVLASPADAARLHQLLRHRHGYQATAACPEHHLPALRRVGALPVEVHIQLGPQRTGLDARIWLDARAVAGTDLVVPSATASLLHAVEHGALVHWAMRYRLRDLLDVAEAWRGEVDREEVTDYLSHHPQRGALTTMLGGVRRFAADISLGQPSAWRTVRRVARARYLVAASIPDEAYATSLCIAGGVLAEASPRALLRPAQLALFGVKQAQVAPRAS
jgi:hypothetical protein